MKKNLSKFSSPEDELRAENALLKLKLETELGMTASTSGDIDPELEHEFLRNVYELERQFSEGKMTTVYERIGAPAFTAAASLNNDEISRELRRLRAAMEEAGIGLDTLCEYDDEVIYRFITEELFRKEIADIRIPGMMAHFIYEEFHPNHDYSLRELSRRFIDRVLKGKWDPEYDRADLAEIVALDRKDYSRDAFGEIVRLFQGGRISAEIESFDFTEVHFDIEKGNGRATGNLAYTLDTPGAVQSHRGEWLFEFEWSEGRDDWAIRGVQLPGFSVMS